jgi:hypothetical protein
MRETAIKNLEFKRVFVLVYFGLFRPTLGINLIDPLPQLVFIWITRSDRLTFLL